MHSGWNSCPHGRLMTLLTPSTYSSKQTTHSTCLPMYFFHWLETRREFFSCEGDLGTCKASSTLKRSPGSGTPVVVRDRGRDRDEPCNKGVVGEELVGEGVLGD